MLRKPGPGGAVTRPTGTEVPRKFSVGKGQVSRPNNVPAVILAVDGWSRLRGVCRASEDEAESNLVAGDRGTFLWGLVPSVCHTALKQAVYLVLATNVRAHCPV